MIVHFYHRDAAGWWRKKDETSEQMILEFFSCVLWIFTYDQRYGNQR